MQCSNMEFLLEKYVIIYKIWTSILVIHMKYYYSQKEFHNEYITLSTKVSVFNVVLAIF